MVNVLTSISIRDLFAEECSAVASTAICFRFVDATSMDSDAGDTVTPGESSVKSCYGKGRYVEVCLFLMLE